MEIEDYSTYEVMDACRELDMKTFVEAYMAKIEEHRKLTEEVEALKKELILVKKELSEAYEIILEKEDTMK